MSTGTHVRKAKTRWGRLVIVTATVLVLVVVIGYRPVGYRSLDQLVQEIAEALENEDRARFDALCHLPVGHLFERLVSQQRERDFVMLLREKPECRSTYGCVLGGNGPLLGDLRLVFVRQLDDHWYLRQVTSYR